MTPDPPDPVHLDLPPSERGHRRCYPRWLGSSPSATG